MLLRRPLVHVFVCVELRVVFLCGAKVGDHALAVDAFLQSQINTAIFGHVEQVIALVLRVMHPKMVLYVLVSGCTWNERFPPSMVSRKSKRMGNSVPKRACTASPRSRRGCCRRNSIKAFFTCVPPAPGQKVVSSRTRPQQQAQYGTV